MHLVSLYAGQFGSQQKFAKFNVHCANALYVAKFWEKRETFAQYFNLSDCYSTAWDIS